MTIGPITFAAPLALWALAVLPVLYWLLRATPPPPQRRFFPPARLLQDIQTDQISRERAPLWLVLLRAFAAALMIIGFARPGLSASAMGDASGRTLIVIDDGWTSAPFWSDARGAALSAARAAERTHSEVVLLRTAPTRRASDVGVLTAADGAQRIGQMEPQAWRPDRADALRRLGGVQGRFSRVVWVSDGLDDPSASAFAAALQARGPVTAHTPPRTARALVGASVGAQGVDIALRRAPNGSDRAAVTVETRAGRSLASTEVQFSGESANARLPLPAEIAARAARVRIVGEQSAGAVRLIASGSSRPFIGLVDASSEGQPLLSELYYVDRALSPYASIARGEVTNLISQRVGALILPDASQLAPGELGAINRFLDDGGLVVRFAGPRMANDAGQPLPVRLRPGARSLGGAIAWERPLHIADYPAAGPFAGLTPPADVSVRRQVLAEPSSLEQASVWASLEDGSPLVTAASRGRGLVVLVHVGARPDWSDLPLSGAFVDLLRRTLSFAGRTGSASTRDAASGAYTPQRLLDGFGAFVSPPSDTQPVAADAFARARPSAATPPGIYERAGIAASIDAAPSDTILAPLRLPIGVRRAGLDARGDEPIAGWFLGAATALIALDLLIALFLVGRLPRFLQNIRLPARAAAPVVLAALLLISTNEAHAQADDPTLVLRLAYVRTGDATIDATSRNGLEAVTRVLRERTAVEPGPTIGIDLTRDDLSALPFIYWPATDTPRPLSDAALANLDRYLRLGGLVLLDTRDANSGQATSRPAATLLRGLDAPPLELVTSAHVASRSFYLLRSFPGRFLSTRLWAESGAAAEARDGVAALFVGDGDWASAWAGAGGVSARQRELALRFGVNMVMVALTGNYKTDQVHAPTLLERMGRGQ